MAGKPGRGGGPYGALSFVQRRVLAESCFYQGEPVFRDGEAVLELLTTREMEGLLRRLSSGTALGPAEENPVFDEARFEALWEG